MFYDLMTEAEYWGHQHYLLGDNHSESARICVKSRKLNGPKLRCINGANFKNAKFEDIDFSSFIFNNCNFDNSRFSNCNFHEASFSYCSFDLAILENCLLESTKFLSSSIGYTYFKSTDISHASFQYCKGSNSEVLWIGINSIWGETSIDFIATQHRVWIGCSTWSLDFFLSNHREIARNNTLYADDYRRNFISIQRALIRRGWIFEPSLLSKLISLLPTWIRLESDFGVLVNKNG